MASFYLEFGNKAPLKDRFFRTIPATRDRFYTEVLLPLNCPAEQLMWTLGQHFHELQVAHEIGCDRHGNPTARYVLSEWPPAQQKDEEDMADLRQEAFWALRDLSLEISSKRVSTPFIASLLETLGKYWEQSDLTPISEEAPTEEDLLAFEES